MEKTREGMHVGASVVWIEVSELELEVDLSVNVEADRLRLSKSGRRRVDAAWSEKEWS